MKIHLFQQSYMYVYSVMTNQVNRPNLHWQVSPCRPGGQTQVKLKRPSTQVAPCPHGLSAQSSPSRTRRNQRIITSKPVMTPVFCFSAVYFSYCINFYSNSGLFRSEKCFIIFLPCLYVNTSLSVS